ncbi:hypothetical protein ACSNN5_30430, partial [Brevibacillus formosus]|uniref:hypothetical protein n=1 Tax=Brevibacillus formosus TaxID=54913 RepID=UPI003F1B0249
MTNNWSKQSSYSVTNLSCTRATYYNNVVIAEDRIVLIIDSLSQINWQSLFCNSTIRIEANQLNRTLS